MTKVEDSPIDLSQYSEDNPLVLDKELTFEQQLLAFNENYFGTQTEMHEDYEYPVGVSENMVQLTRKEKGTWWGSLESVFRYAIQNCVDLGYIPWKVNYIEFDKEGLDGGLHKFVIICEDRRINHSETGLGQP